MRAGAIQQRAVQAPVARFSEHGGGRNLTQDAACAQTPSRCAGALQIIESDLLFRNHEVIAPSKSKAIQKLLLSLYRELRGVAEPLVSAFAIPDLVLRAPIGTSSFVNAQDSRLYDNYLQAAGWDLRELF